MSKRLPMRPGMPAEDLDSGLWLAVALPLALGFWLAAIMIAVAWLAGAL